MTTHAEQAAKIYPDMATSQPTAQSAPKSDAYVSPYDAFDRAAKAATPADAHAIINGREPKTSVIEKNSVAQKPAGTSGAQEKTATQSSSAAPVDVTQATQTVTSVAEELGVMTDTIPSELSDYVAKKGYGAEDVGELMQLHTRAIQHAQSVQVEKWTSETLDTFSEQDIGVAKQALNRYATPELKALLNATGLGSHPEVVALFTRIGGGR